MPVTQISSLEPVRIVDIDDPPGIVFNRSTTIQALWGTNQSQANRADASILDPNATLAVNGDAEIWMVSASGTIAVDYMPNGESFFVV